MAERYEVVIDFAEYSDNTLLTLRNRSADNNIDYATTAYAMRFRVRGDATSSENNAIPDDWADRFPAAECMSWSEQGLRDESVKRREFKFIRKHGQWTIDGKTWEDVIDSDYEYCMADPAENAIEIWDLTNTSGGWFHPVHIHLVDFQILARLDSDGNPRQVHPYERGPKDVAYVGENETVRVAMRFGGPSAGEGWPTPRGRYMMHCHNLVHEDHDMMMQFNVGDADLDPTLNPIGAAAPVNL
jgi:FtsP/CotA-like multicopper oxidase with cupredoxin domain